MTTTELPPRRGPGRPVTYHRGPVSDQQLEALRLLAHGLTTGAVARRLGLGESTVRMMLSRAYARLGARNSTHAVGLLASAGLLRVTPASTPFDGVVKGASHTGTVHWARYERLPTGRAVVEGEPHRFPRLLPLCQVRLAVPTLVELRQAGEVDTAEVTCGICQGIVAPE